MPVKLVAKIFVHAAVAVTVWAIVGVEWFNVLVHSAHLPEPEVTKLLLVYVVKFAAVYAVVYYIVATMLSWLVNQRSQSSF